MFCSKCGIKIEGSVNFCRNCGVGFQDIADEFAGKGIADVFIGDGFLFVAVLLASVQSSISSVAWLLLLIPAFFFFGRGFSSILKSRQIRRRRKERHEFGNDVAYQLPAERTSFVETMRRTFSGELVGNPSVTERTTRDL